MKTLKDLPNIEGKNVIVRVDFNVPVDESGAIKNDKRIQIALPTLKELLSKNPAQIILMTHMGRPKGERIPRLSTGKVAERLGELLGETVEKVDDWGENGLPESKLVMLENLRFDPREKSKEAGERETFAKQLASLADIYVNEAFSNSHRDHASMTGVPALIPGFAGLGVEKEMTALKKALESPEHPLVAVVGGLKADKLTAVKNLLPTADAILMAGALAFTLLKAKGLNMGASKIDQEGIEGSADMIQEILNSPKVSLPTDAVIADDFSETSNHETVSVEAVKDGYMALDIGPETAQNYVEKLKSAKTILWFGPIGVFEMEPFSHGTRAIGTAMAESDALTIVGGGDSASATAKLGLEEKMTLVSTGGGASLKVIEGNKLVAIEALT